MKLQGDLGVDKLSETAKKFGLGKKVFGKDVFDNEKNGLVPNTQWKKNALGRNWLLGETIITGIGQGLYSNNSNTIMFNDCSNS